MKPIVIESDKIIMFDVDDTLVEWIHDSRMNWPDIQARLVEFNTPFSKISGRDHKYALLPIEDSIELLINESKRGMFIVVWSAGGYEWAKEVVRGLELEPYVDLIMSKPLGYIDDLACNEWMGQRIRVRKGKISDYQKKQLERKY